MSGVVDRSDIYKSVEKTLDALIAKNINHILQAGKEIRRAEVGEGIAAAEEKRGQKTDEEYAKEAVVRKEERAREKKREDARKRREDEKDRLRAEAAKHAKIIEKLQSQNERRLEREAARAEREKAIEERRRRDRPKDDHDAETEKEREKPKVQDPDAVPPTPVAPPMDNKALEEAALALLLQEGRELAAKNGPPKPEPELSDSEAPHRKPHVSPPKGPAADRNKVPIKPRLGYSSTPLHQGSGTPIPPPQAAGRPRSRSPYKAPSARPDRSRSPDQSRRQSRSYSYRDEDARIQADLDHKAIYKAQMQAKRDTDAEAFKKRGCSERDEGEYRSRSLSKATERDPGRDRDRDRERSKRHEYEYSRDQSRHPDDRPRSRDRERERPRYDEREKTYTRPRREEAPEHIDRYVPGGAAPAREKRRSTLENGGDRDDKEKNVREDTRDRDASNRDRDRDRDTRDRDSSYRDSKRDYRERSSYHDRDRNRDRDEYDRDRYRDRESRDHRDRERGDHRDRDRDRDRGEEKNRGYERERDRDRDGREERPYTRPRREPAPENIDRYVPGAG